MCSQLERQLAAASAEVDSLKGAVTVANEARALAVTQVAQAVAQLCAAAAALRMCSYPSIHPDEMVKPLFSCTHSHIGGLLPVLQH